MAETMIGHYLLTQLNKMREANCLCDLELISSDGASFKVHHAVFVALNQRHFERYHHGDHLMEETWLSSTSKRMLLSMVTSEELSVVVEFIYGVPVALKSRFDILKGALKKLAMDNLINEQASFSSSKDVGIKIELEEAEVQEVSDTIDSVGSPVTLVKITNNKQTSENVRIKTELEEAEVQEVSDTIDSVGSPVTLVKITNNKQTSENVRIKTELEEAEVQEVSDTIDSVGSPVTLVKITNNIQTSENVRIKTELEEAEVQEVSDTIDSVGSPVTLVKITNNKQTSENVRIKTELEEAEVQEVSDTIDSVGSPVTLVKITNNKQTSENVRIKTELEEAEVSEVSDTIDSVGSPVTLVKITNNIQTSENVRIKTELEEAEVPEVSDTIDSVGSPVTLVKITNNIQTSEDVRTKTELEEEAIQKYFYTIESVDSPVTFVKGTNNIPTSELENIRIKTELEEEEVQEVSNTIESVDSQVTLVNDTNNIQQDNKNLDPLMMSSTETNRKQKSFLNTSSNGITEKDFKNKTTSCILQKNCTNAAQKENIDNLGVCKAKKSNLGELNCHQLNNLLCHKSLSVKLVRLPENIKNGFLCTYENLPDRKSPLDQRHNVEADTYIKKVLKPKTFRHQRRQAYQNRLRNHSKGRRSVKLSSLISAKKMDVNGTKTMEVAPKSPCKKCAYVSLDTSKQDNGRNGLEEQPCACNNPVDRIFTEDTSVNEKMVDHRMGNINDKNERNINKNLNILENSSMESPFKLEFDGHDFETFKEGPQSSFCQNNLQDSTDHSASTVRRGRGRSLSLCQDNQFVESNANVSKEKRGRGRPRSLCKNNPDVKGNALKETQGKGRQWSFCQNYLHLKTAHNTSKEKRGRGRPRSLGGKSVPVKGNDITPKEKRGRGRPRSLSGKSVQVKGNDITAKEELGRGRPRPFNGRFVQVKGNDNNPKGRGRPQPLCLTSLKDGRDDVPIENGGKERPPSSSIQITEHTSGSICDQETPNKNADIVKLHLGVQNDFFKKKRPCYAFDNVKRDVEDNLGNLRSVAQNSFENDVVQSTFQNNSNMSIEAVDGIQQSIVDSRKGSIQNKHETLIRHLMQTCPTSYERKSKDDSSGFEFSISTPSRQVLPTLQPEFGSQVKNSDSCTDIMADDGSWHDKTSVSPHATSLKYHLDTKSISDINTCNKDKQPATKCTNICSGNVPDCGNLLVSSQSSLFKDNRSESQEDQTDQNTIKPLEYSVSREKLSTPVSIRLNHQPHDRIKAPELDIDLMEPADEHWCKNVVCEKTSDKKFLVSKEMPMTVNSMNGTNGEGKQHGGNDTLPLGKKGHEMSIEMPNPYVLHLNKASVCDGNRMLLAQVRNKSKGIMQTGQITNRFPLYPHKYRPLQIATLRSILPKPLDQTSVDESDMENSISMIAPLTRTEITSSNQYLPEKQSVRPDKKVKVFNENISNSLKNTEDCKYLSLKTEAKRRNEAHVPLLRNILQKPSAPMFVPVTCTATPSSNQCFPEKSIDGNNEEKHCKSLTFAFGKKGQKRPIETSKPGDNNSDAFHFNKTSVNERNSLHLAQLRNHSNGIKPTCQITNRFTLNPCRATQVATLRSILPKPLDQTPVNEQGMENSAAMIVPLTCTGETSSNQCLPQKLSVTPEKNRMILLEKSPHIQNTGKCPRPEVKKDNEVSMLRSILPKSSPLPTGYKSDRQTSTSWFVPLTCTEKISSNQGSVNVTSEKQTLLLTEKVPHLMHNTGSYQRNLHTEDEKDHEDICEERKHEGSKSSRNMPVGLKSLDTVIEIALSSYNKKYSTCDSVRKQGDVKPYVDDISEEDSVPLSVLALTLKSKMEKETLKQNTCGKLRSSDFDLNANIAIDKCTDTTVRSNQEKPKQAQCTNEVENMENMGSCMLRNMCKEDTELSPGNNSYLTVGLGQTNGSKSPYKNNQLFRQKYSEPAGKRRKLARKSITVKKDGQCVCDESIEIEFNPENVLKKTLSFVEDEAVIP